MGSRQNLNLQDTIFSLCSGALPSAVAIVRLSGGDSFSIASKVYSGVAPLLTERGMIYGRCRSGEGDLFDDALFLCFPGPNSFTGESCVEIQCHGSVAVVTQLLETLQMLGARQAERGEFAYRAFLNGRMSAADLENLADVFVAREPGSLKTIFRRREGAFQAKVAELRSALIGVQAVLDTSIDFPEEHGSVAEKALPRLRVVEKALRELVDRYRLFRSGSSAPRLVLAGAPNSGKSSLFNAILSRNRALVHGAPGTTRDVIEEDIRLGGVEWKLVDTAGIREGQSVTEIEGIELGREYLEGASAWILVVDGTVGVSATDRELLAQFAQKPHWIVWNKKDCSTWNRDSSFCDSVHFVSVKTGEGVVELVREIRDFVGSRPGVEVLPTETEAVRVGAVVERLARLADDLSSQVPPEVLAEENRQITMALEEVSGEVSTEQVLDRVFGEFCIGK